MMQQQVYRTVEVIGNEIVWVSPTIYLSKENVMFAVNAKAESFTKYFDCEVKPFEGHRWDSVCLNECGKDNWVSVEKCFTATNEKGYKKDIGFISYEAV